MSELAKDRLFGEHEVKYKKNIVGDHRWLIYFPNGHGASILPNNGYTVLPGWEYDSEHFEVCILDSGGDALLDHPLMTKGGDPVKGLTETGVAEFLSLIKSCPHQEKTK